MPPLRKVIIGIQARSTSSRLPGKVFEYVGPKTILQHVVDASVGAARYLNKHSEPNGIRCEVALVIPRGDAIKKNFKPRSLFEPVHIVEGPENDVLTRYMGLVEAHSPDYIVRVTADCPLLPHFVISKHIKNAVINNSDYESNVDERVRTVPDGWDCEVISRKLLEYADQNAKEASDREHVTTYIRKSPPPWIKHGTTIGFLPLFDMLPKLSVDTQEDLDRVRSIYAKIDEYHRLAQASFGAQNVHRF